jgi:hypothetical protein
MPAKASAKRTTAKLLFTRKQRSQLSKLLYAAQAQGPHDRTLQRLDRLAAKFTKDIRDLGFRPRYEIFDRCETSEEFEKRWTRRCMKRSSPEERKIDKAGLNKADSLVRGLVRNIARIWKKATGHRLPTLETEVLTWCGPGYRREFTALAGRHPLWLILDAVGLKLAAWHVNWLDWYVHRRTGEKMGYDPYIPYMDE